MVFTIDSLIARLEVLRQQAPNGGQTLCGVGLEVSIPDLIDVRLIGGHLALTQADEDDRPEVLCVLVAGPITDV